MAELYWDWAQYELSAASENIGEVYSAVGNQMQQNGWQGVQHGADLHGFKPGIDLFAAVVFLFIGNRSFWRVIAVGGGSATAAQAQQEIAEIKNIIANLHFL